MRRADRSKSENRSIRRLWPLALSWLGFTALAVLFQWQAGAYEAGFGNHPDEGAHFVTGLMVRDYLAGGMPQHPMRFAEDYYAHYPKVSIGHYPPGFYLLEGLWLLVFPVGRASAMAMMAALAGVFGALVYTSAGRARLPVSLAALLGAVAISMPLTQQLTSMVMSDLLLAILVVGAALAFIRFLERPRWLESLLFGVLATGAAMTKGSGLLLALVPGLAILIGGNLRILKCPSLWLAPLPVILIAGPWFWFSSGITAEGMSDRTIPEHMATALPYFGGELVRVYGLTLLIPAIIGAGWVVVAPDARRSPFWSVILSVPLALIVFYSLVPAGLEPRYLLPTVPSVLLLATAGLRWVLSLAPERWRSGATVSMTCIVAACFALEVFAIRQLVSRCFEAPLRELAAKASGKPLKLLVSSDPRGEGAFVSEVAIADPARPSHTVDRGSKILATSDWMGRGYQETFEDDQELRSYLEEAAYDAILVDDEVPKDRLRPHQIRLVRVLNGLSGYKPVREKLPANPSRSDQGGLYVVERHGP